MHCSVQISGNSVAVEVLDQVQALKLAQELASPHYLGKILHVFSWWRLLHGLGRLLASKKARYQLQAGSLNDHNGVQSNAELIEVELRRVFIVKEISQNLDAAEFEHCQAKLNSLCLLLDGFARPLNAQIGSGGLSYPRLRALTGFLERTSGPVDLASGPNETLFRLPHDAGKLDDCLRVVIECNDVLSRLLAPSLHEPVIQPNQGRKKKRSWKKFTILNQAIFVLENLFKNSKCGTPHEVLLKLIEGPDENSVLPSLQLILSACPELELWQEARCDPWAARDESSILPISDICVDLRQHTGQGKALTLLIEKYGLFGAWSAPTSSVAGVSKDSLDQLILNGIFRPLSLNTFHAASPARISIKDKRVLTVELGYCLMDFFDADFTSKKIHFLDFSKPGLEQKLPYLAFDSKLSVTDDSYSFWTGHPTLLSFAKLLLEIDCGENYDLDIDPDISKNKLAWAELMDYLDRLKLKRSDSYVQAIRGCLVVHRKITKALRSRDLVREDADFIIRKNLHKEIVHKLELGLDESIPRSARKRQRSESPPPSDHWDGAQAVSSTRAAMQSVKVERTAPRHKKRLTPGPQKWLSASGLCDDNTLAEITADKYQPALINSLNNKKHEPIASPESAIPARGSRLMPSLRPFSRNDFEIAIICALPLEFDAVSYTFDEFWDENGDQYGRAEGDPNSYTTGRVGKYDVVLALLPHMGKTNAASAAASMRSSYGGLRLALIVGVCGGMPHGRHSDILLGDVIISKTVFQYDFGRCYSDKFVCKNTLEDNLGRLNKDTRNLVSTFETDRGIDQLKQRTAHFLLQLQANATQTGRQSKYDYPGIAKDKLFGPTYRHKHHSSHTCICRDCFNDSDPVCDEALSSSCADLQCDNERLVARKRLQGIQQLENDGRDLTPQPAVHVGAVASGDMVMKSAADRDRISREAGVIAFEMEGAGVWDEVPCIVVKGVCDYADSHKHKGWQNFAAATAACASKAILERYIRTDKA
ncbi:hypothetical protein N7495_004670 [Penicillium taxi]|uniref:uncharacterized protein n=1 Tax=Penicillium taxi TaxID=168475 RepID=UPI002544EFEC|nr:uncharacterized protein N7495_004670 [Penicillium taxi]KAJ5899926.1 hypothetical protein N7495_004670 [Penicillium taxi]